MMLEKMEGTWEGFYTYGPEYSEQFQSIKEEFVLELKVKDGIITGTCVDPFTSKYFAEPATVEGVLIDNNLSLIKKYPCFLGVDENDQTYIDKSMPSHEIHYSGIVKRILFSTRYFVEGSWDMSGSFRDQQGNARYYTMDGDWEMRQK